MKENKYYIPNIKDFYFGYDCEISSSGNNNWSKFTLLTYLDFEGLDHYIEENRLRTSYLTKKQVENEGWDFKWGNSLYNEFRKEKYVLFLYEDLHQITILKNRDGENICVYGGNCLSINEFRTICKLLDIE